MMIQYRFTIFHVMQLLHGDTLCSYVSGDKVSNVMEEIEDATTPVCCSDDSMDILHSPRMVCSIPKLCKLIGKKHHMINCNGNYKLNFETSGCCLLM